MPTQQELELLALLAQEQRRNGSAGHPQMRTASTLPGLPDLSPDMLLSASARREVEAARSLAGFRPDLLPAAAIERRLTPREVAASRAPIEMALNDDMGDIDLDTVSGFGSRMASETNDDHLLSSLFMGREAQEAQSVLGGGSTYAASGYDIEYDTDSMIEGRTSPNESARFQIGRQSPPRMPFSGRMGASPSDGVVVSQRAGGAWQRTAAAPRPDNARSALQAVREAAMRPLEPVQARPAPAPPRPAMSRQNIPTVYQRIMSGGAVDDD